MPAGGRLAIALLVACTGLLGVAATARGPFSVPPGVPVLVLAAAVCALVRGRVGVFVGLAAATVVGLAALGPELGEELGGGHGLGRCVSRWLELAGLAAAVAIGVAAVRPRRSPPTGPSGRRSKEGSTRRRGERGDRGQHRGPAGQVVGLLVLSAVGAELLSAYGDTTGDPAGIAFSLVFFAALYGAPALLARELVRRRGWGWPSLLLAFGALGVAQACLIDQSMFSVDYQGYEGWEETRAATLLPALGISASNAFNFIVGHVIYSFAAPVAIVEAWHPERARQPWLGVRGTVLAGLAYAGSAALILSDPTSHSGSAPQLAMSVLLVLTLVGLSVLVGRSSEAGRTDATSRTALPSLPVWWVFAAVFTMTLVSSVFPENWIGLIVGVAATSMVAVGVLLAARRTAWSPRHTAAVALAFLSVRSLLAFTYYPLLGDVAAVPKYAHNVVMLTLVLAAGWLALRDGPHQELSAEQLDRADRS